MRWAGETMRKTGYSELHHPTALVLVSSTTLNLRLARLTLLALLPLFVVPRCLARPLVRSSVCPRIRSSIRSWGKGQRTNSYCNHASG
ncbi:hypothetical protein BJ912DRAFT_966017 [Pholiota molesta]|nr:hypothetical protein BJ912DRAFT_966017 [Pholiota molesta]